MKELIELIELLLEDGIIDENERALILRRAGELGVSEAECNIILNSMVGRNNKQKVDSPTTPSRVFKKRQIVKTEPAKLELEVAYNKKIDDELKATQGLFANAAKQSKELHHLVNESKEQLKEIELLVENENRAIENECVKLSEIKANFDAKLQSYISFLKNSINEKSLLIKADFDKKAFYKYFESLSFNDALYKSMIYELDGKALKRKIVRESLVVLGVTFLLGLYVFFLINTGRIIFDFFIFLFVAYLSVTISRIFLEERPKKFESKQKLESEALKWFNKLNNSNVFNVKEIEHFKKAQAQVNNLSRINIANTKEIIKKGELFSDFWILASKMPQAIDYEDKLRLYDFLHNELAYLSYIEKNNSVLLDYFCFTSHKRKQLFGDTTIAKEYLGKAVSIAEDSNDWRKLAISWKELFGDIGKAKDCLAKAESIAKDSLDWSTLAESWKELFGDTGKAKDCLAKAESIAKYSSHWSILARSWKELFGDAEKEQQCFEMAKR